MGKTRQYYNGRLQRNRYYLNSLYHIIVFVVLFRFLYHCVCCTISFFVSLCLLYYFVCCFIVFKDNKTIIILVFS